MMQLRGFRSSLNVSAAGDFSRRYGAQLLPPPVCSSSSALAASTSYLPISSRVSGFAGQRVCRVASKRKNDDVQLASNPVVREQEKELERITKQPVVENKYGQLIFWLVAAVAFGGGIWATEGSQKAQEYFAGYLLEQSLSVDNLFVFVLVFNYFKTPASAQPKVLNWGIATAAVLRAVMIVLGVELIQKWQPVLAVFAGILIYSSYQLLFTGEDDDEEEDLSNNQIVKFCRGLINSTDSYDGDNFFTKLADGTKVATPLLLTLAVVELSDVVFAVDSIPAVFGVTLDPFIVYTSNLFAILSLRALYFFVSTVMTELRYLDKSVAVVLGFIGAKMLAELGGVEVPTDVSLGVVAVLLSGGVGASLLLPEPAEEGEGEDKKAKQKA